MGTTALLPSWSLNCKCNCCNNEGKTFAGDLAGERVLDTVKDAKNYEINETGLARPKRPSWIRRSFKTGKTCKTNQEEDCNVVKRSACLQFTQTDEKKIPNETVQDERYQ